MHWKSVAVSAPISSKSICYAGLKLAWPSTFSLSMQADHICKRESEMFDIYLLPPGEDPETCPSWLRMRNRDGRYDLRFEEWVVDDPFVISPRISFEV